MSVTNYRDTSCKYRIPRLDKYVYLISSFGVGKIHIDDGEAYIENLRLSPIQFSCYDVSVSESEELDERYAFTHSISFSIRGYHTLEDLYSKFHIVLKDMEGTYWMMNPEFPAKVTYTYTLEPNSSHTDFTLSTVSNYPMLRIRNMADYIKSDDCIPYVIDGFKTLKLNESKYTARKDTEILVTNSGFKDIIPSKDSSTFTETFDGENVSHTISFNIPLDSFQDSWHYNLLEFLNNTYSAIIGTKEGRNILCGFGLGMQPSYTISGGMKETDVIEITLSDMHNTGHFIGLTDVTVSDDDRRNYVWAPELGYECVGEGTAIYTIQREVDNLGNPTGNYRCLEGYEQHFREMGLNIVGTFSSSTKFPNSACAGFKCSFQTDMPYTITFNVDNCRNYSILSDTDWKIQSDHINVSVSPSSGKANVPYQIEVCANSIDNATHHLNVTYCDGLTTTYDVRLEAGHPCFTAGQTFDISANAQYVNVPITCCTQSAQDKSGVISDITLSTSLMKVYVPQNSTGKMRSMVIEVKMCDGSTVNVTINQGYGFEKWVTESSECNGSGQRCDLQRRYTGTTAGFINTRTNDTRYANCFDDPICGNMTRWVKTTETYCDGGKNWYVEEEEMSVDGKTWTKTGYKRLGEEAPDPSNECELPTEEWKDVDGYICDDTTKYSRQRLYLNGVATDVYRKTDKVIEVNSADCGYVKGSDDWKCDKWEAVAGDYICDSGIKYKKEQRYVSDDCNNYTPTGIYRKGSVIEWNSEDCGWKPEYSDYSYEEYRDEDGYVCNGYDKWSIQRIWLSKDGVNWIRTDMTLMGTMLEKNSFDCGYIPSEKCSEWQFVGYTCDGTTKYERLRKWISDDCADRWYETDIYKIGNVIEEASVDCGWSDGYEYAWNVISDTVCVGYDKYRMYQYQRRKIGTTKWTDVIPTQKSYDGNGTMTPMLVENDSADCGWEEPPAPNYAWMKDGTICDECGLKNYKEMWVTEGGYICDGYDKYEKVVKKVSLDGGVSYGVLLPEESMEGRLIEANSEDCGYIEPEPTFDGKFRATYSDGKTYEKNCDGNPNLTSGNTRPSGYTYRNMETVEIGDCVTDIYYSAFEGFTGLTEVLIPKTVTWIWAGGFMNCKSLKKINIPDSVEVIGADAFEGCSGLTEITLPDKVRSIADYAFYECSGLTSITVLAIDPPDLGPSTSTKTFANTNNCPIYVPDGSVDAYKNAKIWTRYADRIKPLSEKT